jgi:hypothetical protein
MALTKTAGLMPSLTPEAPMNDADLLAEHLRALEYLIQYGDLTDSDRTITRARLMVVVGKLRQKASTSGERDDMA